jgi:hypothetical protein
LGNAGIYATKLNGIASFPGLAGAFSSLRESFVERIPGPFEAEALEISDISRCKFIDTGVAGSALCERRKSAAG